MQPRLKVRTLSGSSRQRLVLIPTPERIAAFVRALPPGQSTTLAAMKRLLAREAGADLCCPITTRAVLNDLCRDQTPGPDGLDAGQQRLPLWRLLDGADSSVRSIAGLGADFGRLRQSEVV